MVRTTILLILGFILFMTGFVSLILLLVGAKLSIISFIDSWGATTGLIIRLLMIFGGIVLVYITRSKFEK